MQCGDLTSKARPQRVLLLRRRANRQREPLGSFTSNCPVAPVGVMCVRDQGNARLFGSGGDLIDVIRRFDVEPQPDALGRSAPLLAIVWLGRAETFPLEQHDTQQHAILARI